MGNVRIFLDAGHGGQDSGACLGHRHESDDVLKLVLKIGKLLETGYDNVKVGYSRKTDVYESPAQKAKRSNEFKADYFFSFHRNAANGNAQGFETEYQSHSSFKDTIMRDIGHEMKELGFVRREDKLRSGLAVLNQTSVPALLFEIGFIDNQEDNKIFDKQFDKIAASFAKVIGKGCGLRKK